MRLTAPDGRGGVAWYGAPVSGILEAADSLTRLQAARAFIAQLPADARVCVVAPSYEAAADLLRPEVERRGALFGYARTTLPELAHELARPLMLEAGNVAMGGLAPTAMCARVIGELSATGELGRLSAVENQPGLARAVARTLDQLRMGGVDAAALRPQDDALARVLARYVEQLQARGLCDRADVHSHARAACTGERATAGDALLILDPVIEHRLEAELIGALMQAAPRTLCTLPAGDERARHLLQRFGDLEVEQRSPANASGGLEQLRQHLFERTAPTPGGDESLEILSAPGEGRECVEIARKLLWEAEAGTPFERMAVLCHAAAHYRPHIAEALRRAGIPAHFAAGSSRPDAAGRALLSLLACKAERLSATRFAEYLSLGVVPERTDAGEPPRGADASERFEPPTAQPDDTDEDDATEPSPLRRPRHWEKAIVDAAVMGGRDRWRRRLHALDAELSARLTRDPDPPERDAIERERADLAELTAYALPLIDALDTLPEATTWSGWLDALGALATRAIARPQRLLSVLAELQPMGELGPVSIEEVLRVLHQRLAELPSGAGSDRGGKVFVGTPQQARAMDFDVVCVVGLAEKIFPQKVREDPMLLDGSRRAIDAGLSTQPDAVAAERLALRLAAGAARRRLVLSYPRIDLDRVRPRVPSFYALEVLRAAEGELPGYDELMARAESATAARVGWPAPLDGQRAIDTAEHDLSVLQDVLVAPPEQTVGAARYLLSENPHLARALRFRARRWSVRAFTPADGLVEPGEGAAAALAGQRLEARAYSATALQAFASCPYRFLLQSVHRLRPQSRPEPLEQMDGLQRGRLFHDVQFSLLSRLRDADLLPVTDANLESAQRMLDEQLDDETQRMREQLAPAIERVFVDGVAQVRADLRQWLKRRAAQGGYTPRHFELAFGAQPGSRVDPDSSPEPVALACGIQLRGSIDLVEEHDGALRATDYKTGRATAPDPLVIGGGKVLQPLLYAQALQARFPGARVWGGQLSYCTAQGGFATRAVELDERAEGLAKLLAETVDGALQEGFLPAAPEPGACEHCDYRVVCGPYEEQRVARKDRGRLDALRKLRGAP